MSAIAEATARWKSLESACRGTSSNVYKWILKGFEAQPQPLRIAPRGLLESPKPFIPVQKFYIPPSSNPALAPNIPTQTQETSMSTPVPPVPAPPNQEHIGAWKRFTHEVHTVAIFILAHQPQINRVEDTAAGVVETFLPAEGPLIELIKHGVQNGFGHIAAHVADQPIDNGVNIFFDPVVLSEIMAAITAMKSLRTGAIPPPRVTS